MEKNNKRDLFLKIRVSQEEMDAIKRKFRNSGMQNFSEFIRAMIFEGYIVQLDRNEFKKIMQVASTVSNNINQIALRANSSGNVYPDDILEVKDLAYQIIQPLLDLNCKLGYLKR